MDLFETLGHALKPEKIEMKTTEDYIKELTAYSDADWQHKGYNMEKKPVYTVMHGQKFDKVIVETFGSKSVHCFIDRSNGDLYKPASWNARAKGVRGNINNAKKPFLCGEFYR